ncbi:MAG: hypothetical protein AB8G23_08460 [Myxococcota bacterium]
MSSSPDPDSATATSAAPGETARVTQMHGSLVEVMGLGVLILGRSGVGKSECVVELVRRGERLVADDVVRLRVEDAVDAAGENEADRERKGESAGTGEGPSAGPGERIVGWSPEHIRHYIEVRGLGLMSVADLFGPERTLDESEVGFVVRLEDWEKGRQFERIGLTRDVETILGVDIPCVVLPVHAASNLATLVELAIRDWRLREQGVNAAARLDERLRSGDGTFPLSESDSGPSSDRSKASERGDARGTKK